jgi:DNA end-binding protein Ku
MRSVWSGNLAFGLVSIPVRLYPATEAKDVRFHLVDPATGRRVRYRGVVEQGRHAGEGSAADGSLEDDEDTAAAARPPEETSSGEGAGGATGSRADDGAQVEVSFEELARGYEVEPGEQVILTNEELAGVRPERSRTIEIEDFVELTSIDPVYFEKSYVVAPGAGGVSDKPYVLLMRTLERSKRVGIGRFVLRTKPHLVAIRARSGVLALETLFFGDEVRDLSGLAPAASVPIEDRELRLAEELVGMLAADWEPSAYGDTYRQDLLSLIASKAPRRSDQDRDAPAAPSGASSAEALMEALRRSVDEAKNRRRSAGDNPASEAI